MTKASYKPNNWDLRFMALARQIATWSKDRSRKVGCVIVGPAHEIRSTGYNGFPRDVNDDLPARHERPAKYRWTEHAERNAIYNAARSGVCTLRCTIYIPWYPCMDCARGIVQAGIAAVVAVEPDWNDPQYAADFADVQTLFREVGMQVRFVPGEAPVQQQLTPAHPAVQAALAATAEAETLDVLVRRAGVAVPEDE